MITGVEVAGLALGTLPLIITALEHYNNGAKPLKDFLRYRTLIRSMIIDLGTQNILLRNNIEHLLDGLVADIDRAFLLENPGSLGWKDASLTEKLQIRLAGAYTIYTETVKDMISQLDLLRDKIGLDEHGKHRWVDSKSQKKEWKKFMLCLSRKEHESLLLKLDMDNRHLKSLTKSSRDLEPIRSGRRNRREPFKAFAEKAKSLHRLMKVGWSCDCQLTHRANLHLEHRKSDTNPVFRVSFPILHPSPQSSYRWHETDIRPLTVDSLETKIADLSEVHDVTATALACLDALSTTEKETKQQPSSRESGWKKGIIIPRFKSGQGRKSVAWAPEVHVPQDRKSTGVNPKISDLCSALQQANGQPDCLGCLVDDQESEEGFLVSQPSVKTLNRIASLGDILRQQRSVELIAIGNGMMTLSGIRAETRLTKKQRLQLAVILASTTLQLHATPWIDQDWGKHDILFHDDCVDQPHISQHFHKHETPLNITPPQWSPIRNLSVFGLGVLLLELSFGRPLEHFKIDQDPPIFTDLAIARRLLDFLEDEESSAYTDVVRACINCDFGSKVKVSSLENDAFRQAVYDEVVCPLEDEWAHWTGKAR
ncbi:MAG: hypothetical protein Q9214_003740 [Letrouitia sp. 1 TL-2023]